MNRKKNNSSISENIFKQGIKYGVQKIRNAFSNLTPAQKQVINQEFRKWWPSITTVLKSGRLIAGNPYGVPSSSSAPSAPGGGLSAPVAPVPEQRYNQLNQIFESILREQDNSSDRDVADYIIANMIKPLEPGLDPTVIAYASDLAAKFSKQIALPRGKIDPSRGQKTFYHLVAALTLASLAARVGDDAPGAGKAGTGAAAAAGGVATGQAARTVISRLEDITNINDLRAIFAATAKELNEKNPQAAKEFFRNAAASLQQLASGAEVAINPRTGRPVAAPAPSAPSGSPAPSPAPAPAPSSRP